MPSRMWSRQRSGSVVCPSCGRLVGVKDASCFHCGRPNPGLWGFSRALRALGEGFGFAPLVMTACGILYLAALLLDPAGIGGRGGFSIFSPSLKSLFTLGASGSVPVFGMGRWWTVLSAAWLHGGVLHILFNMLWVRNLAPATAQLFGPARVVLIYTAASVGGFALSSLAGVLLPFLPQVLRGAQFTVGASAPVFGLLGALVLYGQRTGSSMVGSQALGYAVILGLFGFIMPGIDNWAHLGGFLGGYGAAAILDPRLPERLDHLLAALACLVATAAAVVASVLTALPVMR